MENLPLWPPSWTTLLLLPALLVGFTVHELAHALVAFMLGDTSQVERKRLSFNPLRHVSWLGMIAFLLLGFGWAKPVWVDYGQLRIRNRPLGMFLVSIAGAAANLMLAVVAIFGVSVSAFIASAVTGRSAWDLAMAMVSISPGLTPEGMALALSSYMITVNLLLALFNLLPLPPLDGFRALMSLFTMARNALQHRSDDVPLARLDTPVLTTRPRPADAPSPAPGEAIQSNGDDESPLSPAQIHFNIGLDYHREGQYDEAIARYRQATVHDDQMALAYYNQGLAYWAKGRLPLAQGAFRAASQSGDDISLQVQAGLRLSELVRAEQDSTYELPPVPPPMEPDQVPVLVSVTPPPLDPGIQRRVWLRLALGGLGMGALALSMWLYVTAVMIGL